MPEMKHPDSSHRIRVSPASVGIYETQGWRVVEPRKTKKTTAAKKSAGK